MNRQLMGRRLVLGAFAVALAVPGLHAAAVVYGPDDFGDRESFEDYCENVGVRLRTPATAISGARTSPVARRSATPNGNDCYTIPYVPPVSDPRVPTGGLGLEPTTNGEEEPLRLRLVGE